MTLRVYKKWKKYKKSQIFKKIRIVDYYFRKEVIKPNSKRQKICELYFEKNFNCVCIAKELGISPQYVSKVLKGYPNYKKEKEKKSEIKHKNYLERKKTNRKLRTKILKDKENY